MTLTEDRPALALRGYQREAIDKVLAAEARGVRRQLGVAATGLGKTVIFAHLASTRPGRTLILAHRDELVSQAVEKLRTWWPGVDVGIVKGPQNETRAHVVVASVQTVSRVNRLEKLCAAWEEESILRRSCEPFDLVVVDECFPAGTMVGPTPIEDLRPGDVVPSWDDETGGPVYATVVTVMRSEPSSLVTVEFEDGTTLTCTSGHPVMTDDGWVPAGALLRDARVLSFAHHAAADRDDLHGVLPPSNDHGEGAAGLVHAPGAGVLLRPVPGCVDQPQLVGTHGSHEQASRVGAHDGAQPYEPPGVGREDEGNSAPDGAQAPGARRERSAAPDPAGDARRAALLADGGHRPNGRASEGRATVALQDRHREPESKGGGRDRRAVAWLAGTPRVRPAEGLVPRWRRVARVEVHERGSDGRFGGRCPDGAVYNVEVAGTHTYRVGSLGVVVHNCHHSAADSYRRVLERLHAGQPGGPLVLGVTATPDRGDGKGLDDLFDEITFNYDILWGIRSGYLSDLRAKKVTLQGLDMRDVKVRQGDYDAGETGRRLEDAGAPEIIVKAWLQHAAGRRTLVFTPTVATAVSVAEEFRHAGVKAASVSGLTSLEERRELLRQFSAGEIDVISNCAVLTEGFDEPRADCIIMARPTKSRALFTQCLDTETEVLTRRGFLGPDALSDDDEIAAYDLETEEVSWSPVLSRVDRPLGDGEQMYALESPSTSLRVTGGHRMVVAKRSGAAHRWSGWSLQEAQDVAAHGDTWRLPVAGNEKVGGVPLTDDELRFIGWFLEPFISKDWPEALDAIDRRQLGVLLEAMHLGDGAKQGGQTWTRRSYHLAMGLNRTLSERLQAICVRRGYRASLAEAETGALTLHVKDTAVRNVGGAGAKDRPTLAPVPATPGERVWCVETNQGTLIVRRHGRVAVVGNCVGRGTRRHPEKVDCLVLDVVGATNELSLVTVPSLFGIDNAQEFEKRAEGVTAYLDRQDQEQVRIGKLKAEDVDLFKKMRREGIAWVQVHHEGTDIRHYQRSLGRDAGGQLLPTVVLRQRTSEHDSWYSALQYNEGGKKLLIDGVTMELAQGVAEDYVRRNGIAALMNADAPWRRGRPSARAVAAAGKWRMKVDPKWNAGQLSDALDAHIARKRQYRTAPKG